MESTKVKEYIALQISLGEPQFLETMQLKYNQEAERKGIYIVGSCGFDSIPSDLGQTVVMRAMDGPVNTIETYLKCTTPPDEPGAIINFATYQCAIYGFAMAHELKSIRYFFGFDFND